MASHSYDPTNMHLGTLIPMSSYPVLTPLTSLTSYLNSSSSVGNEQYNSFIFQKHETSQVSLIRVYLSNGTFKTVDPMGFSTVEEVCHKIMVLLKMKSNESGAIWVMKANADLDLYGGEHFRRQLRLIEVLLQTKY